MTWRVSFPMYGVSSRLTELYQELAMTIADDFRSFSGQACEVVKPQETLELLPGENCLLTQVCGYPLVTQLKSSVQLIATPDYEVPDCQPGYYKSAFIVREASAIYNLAMCRGKTLAINDAYSNSGMNVIRFALANMAENGYFCDVVYSGSHLNSMQMVAEQKVDFASIDMVTYLYAAEAYPDLVNQLKCIQYSIESPGLPLVASSAVPTAYIRFMQALLLSLLARNPRLFDELRIKAFVNLQYKDYEYLLEVKDHAEKKRFSFH